MDIKLYLLACILGAILYRIGGSALHIPFKTKWRDLGVPIVGIVCLYVMIPFNAAWAYWGAMAGFLVLSFGSMTTYWDHWGTDNVEWYEWMLTGFCYGVAALPIALYTGSWIGFCVRTIILMTAITFSNRLKYEWLVEPSRGFVFIATLPLLVI